MPKNRKMRGFCMECRHDGGGTEGDKVLITREYIAVGYNPEVGELDLAWPCYVTMDKQVRCISASVIASPDEVKDVKFGTPVTMTLNIYGGDDE